MFWTALLKLFTAFIPDSWCPTWIMHTKHRGKKSVRSVTTDHKDRLSDCSLASFSIWTISSSTTLISFPRKLISSEFFFYIFKYKYLNFKFVSIYLFWTYLFYLTKCTKILDFPKAMDRVIYTTQQVQHSNLMHIPNNLLNQVVLASL